MLKTEMSTEKREFCLWQHQKFALLVTVVYRKKFNAKKEIKEQFLQLVPDLKIRTVFATCD